MKELHWSVGCQCCIKLLFNLKYLCFMHLIFMEHWVEVSWLSIAYNAHLSHVKVTFAWDDDFVHAIQVKITNYMSNVHLLFMRRLGLFFFFFLSKDKFLANFNLKIRFQPIRKTLFREKSPKFARFWRIFSKFSDFYDKYSKEMNGFCFVSTFISSM